jgi:tetratricopeptide (TPR) repeat protein
MQFLFWLILGLTLGFGAHRLQRTSLVDLERQATEAWNRRDLAAAEALSRQALGRDDQAPRAREVLQQLGVVLRRPEIPLAFAMEARRNPQRLDSALSDVGRLALSSNLFRLADASFQEAVQRLPSSTSLQRQYVALSGLRLEAEVMQNRLREWALHGTPTADLVLMSLGLWSIESRGAEPAEAWLRAAVEADSSDLASRLGLARCLLAMGRYQECVQLLASHTQHLQARLLLAVAHATTSNIAAAEALLPPTAPVEMRGEYWFSKGLIAAVRRDFSAAETAFETAVQFQPLNKTYRSRYVDVMRRRVQSKDRLRPVQDLETVVRIVQRASQAQKTGMAVPLADLSEMCRSIGAQEAAFLLDRAAGKSLGTSPGN